MLTSTANLDCLALKFYVFSEKLGKIYIFLTFLNIFNLAYLSELYR